MKTWGKKCLECDGIGQKDICDSRGNVWIDDCEACDGHGRVKYAEGCWVCGLKVRQLRDRVSFRALIWPSQDSTPVDNSLNDDVHIRCLSTYIQLRDKIE